MTGLAVSLAMNIHSVIGHYRPIESLVHNGRVLGLQGELFKIRDRGRSNYYGAAFGDLNHFIQDFLAVASRTFANEQYVVFHCY